MDEKRLQKEQEDAAKKAAEVERKGDLPIQTPVTTPLPDKFGHEKIGGEVKR